MVNTCIKGMTVDTCSHNPNLGCDCGANPPRKEQASITEVKDYYVRCGEPLCPFYDPKVETAECPMPVNKGMPCLGMGNPWEHYYGLDKPID